MNKLSSGLPQRASDPGLRLHQFGRVTWVHCQQCNGPARLDQNGATCIACGYMTIQQRELAASRWAQINLTDPRCTMCRLPLNNVARPTARAVDGRPMVRVQCPHCREVVDYPARMSVPPGLATQGERWLPLFLTTQVAGNTLWVDNLAHLDALEEWVGATMRERGPVRGMTMMAKLPRWMKSAVNRDKVIRGLRQLRERAMKAGIDE